MKDIDKVKIIIDDVNKAFKDRCVKFTYSMRKKEVNGIKLFVFKKFEEVYEIYFSIADGVIDYEMPDKTPVWVHALMQYLSCMITKELQI